MDLIEERYADFIAYAKNIMGKENKEFFLYTAADIVHDVYLEKIQDIDVEKVKRMILVKIKRGGITSCFLSAERFYHTVVGEQKLCKKCMEVKSIVDEYYKRIDRKGEIPFIFYENICKKCTTKKVNACAKKASPVIQARRKEYYKKWIKKQIETLGDWYIKTNIQQRSAYNGKRIKMSEITQDMIDKKRTQFILERLKNKKGSG